MPHFLRRALRSAKDTPSPDTPSDTLLSRRQAVSLGPHRRASRSLCLAWLSWANGSTLTIYLYSFYIVFSSDLFRLFCPMSTSCCSPSSATQRNLTRGYTCASPPMLPNTAVPLSIGISVTASRCVYEDLRMASTNYTPISSSDSRVVRSAQILLSSILARKKALSMCPRHAHKGTDEGGPV